MRTPATSAFARWAVVVALATLPLLASAQAEAEQRQPPKTAASLCPAPPAKPPPKGKQPQPSAPPLSATTPGGSVNQKVWVYCGSNSVETTVDRKALDRSSAPRPPLTGVPEEPTDNTAGEARQAEAKSCPPTKIDLKVKDISLGISTSDPWMGWVGLLLLAALAIGAALLAAKGVKAAAGKGAALTPWIVAAIVVVAALVGWTLGHRAIDRQVTDRVEAIKASVDQQTIDRLATCEARNIQLETMTEMYRTMMPLVLSRNAPAAPVTADTVPARVEEQGWSVQVLIVILLVLAVAGALVIIWQQHTKIEALRFAKDFLQRPAPATATGPPQSPPEAQ